jgi:cytochrome c oxidase assembly factor CtaG
MGDFFQISSSSVNFLLASVSVLVGNAMPVILPLLALFIGWAILEAIFAIARRPKSYEYTLGEYMKKQRESGGYEPANFLKPKTFSLTEEEEEEEFGD